MRWNTRTMIVAGTVVGLLLVAAAAFAAPAHLDGTFQDIGYASSVGQGQGPGLGLGARAGDGHGREAGFRNGKGYGPEEGRGLKRGLRDCQGKGKPYHCDGSGSS